jgi:predicted  nucleic acid-binding Zn-ribbon protein
MRFLVLIAFVITFFVSMYSNIVAQETDKTSGLKLSEIADTTIIEDAEKIVAEARNLLTNIAKDLNAKERATDFKTIRVIRARLNKKSPELRGLVESLRQYKSSLRSQIQQKRASLLANPTNIAQTKMLEVEIDRAKQEVDALKERGSRAQQDLSNASDEQAKRDLQQAVRGIGLEIRRKEAEMGFIEQKKAESEGAGVSSQKEIDELSGTIEQIDKVLARGQASLRSLDETLVELDEQSGALLQTDILNINYTDKSTYIFAILVGAVIIGFFAIAFQSEKVRDAIFTGDSGIQFVTLFSLVIAIILFGVLHILEGKELSALLGGLSGYILGRGSNRPDEQMRKPKTGETGEVVVPVVKTP